MKNYQHKTQITRMGRYSLWQYLVIILSLSLLTLSALPNFFPEEEVLLISERSVDAEAIDAKTIYQELTSRKLAIESINHSGDSSRIKFTSDKQIKEALPFLKQRLGSDYIVEVIKEDSRPNWLKSLGREPINLGLDLSGGVLFILDVDGEKAFTERMQHVSQTVKSSLREQSLRGFKAVITQDSSVILKSSRDAGFDKADLDETVTEVKKVFPQLTVQFVSKKRLSFSYSNSARLQFHQEIMQQALSTMRSRIEELGITEAVVQRQGSDRIRIELPGVKNAADARSIIGATASLDFYQIQERSGKSFESKDGEKISVNPLPIFSGKHIKNAQAGRDEMGMPLVNLSLNNQGGKKMLKFSAQNIGKPMVTVYSEYLKDSEGKTQKNSKVISVATIQSQLGSRFSITNLPSPQDAHQLALLLRAGSLSAPITIAKQRTIAATLGESNIENGAAALMLGVGFTLSFMALWYRRLGFIANVTLVLNLVCLLGLMSLLPGVVLTLPGIAGLVLTVGMAVDTNVLIFERIKEEKKRGKSLPLAVEHGYRNAFATILDANITTLITAFILYSIGYGPVKGFAITLGLGILTSMFTGVFISRALTNIFFSSTFSRTKRVGEIS